MTRELKLLFHHDNIVKLVVITGFLIKKHHEVTFQITKQFRIKSSMKVIEILLKKLKKHLTEDHEI